MGDRANLRLRYSGDNHLVLYTHWGGSELHLMAQQAVKRLIESGRIGDETYAARNVICELIPADEYDKYTGWGVGFDFAPDAAHPLIEINLVDGRVQIYSLNPLYDWKNEDGEVFESTPCCSFSAQEYVALDYDPRWQTSSEEEAAEA